MPAVLAAAGSGAAIRQRTDPLGGEIALALREIEPSQIALAAV